MENEKKKALSKKTGKRSASAKAQKKMGKRWPIDQLRRRFLSHEWETVNEMAAATGVPVQTLYKYSAHWIAKREELDREAEGRVQELIIEDRAQAIRDMQLRHLEFAKKLFEKARAQLLRKVWSKERGRLVDQDFDSESHALMAARLAMAAEQSLLLRRNEDGPTNNFNGPTALLLTGGGGGELQTQRALRELSQADLQAIIDARDDGQGGASKAGGKGDAGADGGGKKRL